ncbi:hypothetical protein [Methylobacterium bullatum]|uniref:Uncharacterized protein n=1 Tax=Methylobacterium bullatum TaxID=570505 RepID=A0AAV4ZCN8_9HYPH|nr:hypothetical protein [Methylobacterium bullatum]MBD8902741.1 hypothetical protein [Methylobacterium bullatum]GJD41353.1 hypothetical protein OICFNHDK_3836 [Methylobacterium bullatum]
MAKTRFFKTGLCLSINDGGERELSLIVGYDFTPAFKGSYDEPGHGADAEVVSIKLWHGQSELPVPDWLTNFVETDTDLLDSLVADAVEADQADREDAAEYRAELLREEA